MPVISITENVEASPDAVFKAITDVQRLPSWNAAIRKVLDAPSGLTEGAEWVVEMHALGGTWHSRSRVIEIDPGRRTFRYRSCTDDGNPSYVLWSWAIAPSGTGSKVTVQCDINPRTFWRRVLFVHIRRRALARSEITKSLAALSKVAGALPVDG